MIERLGTRRVILGGSVVLVGALPLIGAASNAPPLVAGLIAITVADLFVDVAMNLQGSWLSARRSTPVMNRLHGLWSAGTVIGGLAAAAVALAGVPLLAHLLAAATIAALMLLLASPGLLRTNEPPPPEEPEAPDVRDPRDPTDLEAPQSERNGTGLNGSGRNGSATRSLILLAVVGAAAFTAEIVPGDWAAIRLVEDLDTTAGFASLGYLAFTLGMTTGRMAGDWIEARLGRARLVGSAVLLATTAILIAGLSPSEHVALAAYLVSGLGTGPLFPALYDLAARRRGRPGAGLGALTAGTRTASLLAPATIGALTATDLPIGATTALITVAALIAVAALTRPLTPAPATSRPGTTPRP